MKTPRDQSSNPREELNISGLMSAGVVRKFSVPDEPVPYVPVPEGYFKYFPEFNDDDTEQQNENHQNHS